ncbi:MAG: SRPBCC family protein [Actinocatenispora sp.]
MQTSQSGTPMAVRRSVTVPLDPARAFDLFTARMDAYWPPEHHIGAAELDRVVVEPHAGGRWYERGVDGTECQWGRVAVWDPPGRLVLIWQLDTEWRFDPDLETELEMSFVEESPGRTTVRLEHRNLERYGDQAEAMRAAFESPDAWEGILARYVGSAEHDAENHAERDSAGE